MRKLPYLIGIVAALSILGYLAFAFFFQQSGQEADTGGIAPSQPGLLPSSPPNAFPETYSVTDQFPKTQTITLGTPQGTVEVKNFYKTLVDTEEGSVFLKDADDYRIVYRRDDSMFRIELWSPSSVVRQTAEMEFLELLDINQTDACKLNAEVILFRSAQYGENSRLSFCLGNLE